MAKTKSKKTKQVEIIDGNKLIAEMCYNFWSRRTNNEKLALAVGAGLLIGHILTKDLD